MIEGTIKEIRDAEKKADEMVQEAKRQSLKISQEAEEFRFNVIRKTRGSINI